MEGGGLEGSPRKPGVQITVGEGDDNSEDPVTPESDIVKAKLEAHNIKQMGTLLKPFPLSQVDALLKKHIREAMFQQADGSYAVEIAPLILHGGIWRWMPDFALKPVPMETGRLHVGLQLGPYVVDWTDSHLVAIRTVTSCQPLVLVNLGTEKMYSGAAVDGVASILRAAANVIVQWNTTKKYDLKKCSATAFVEELLKAVGSKTVISPRIKDVLADAQTKGGAKFEAVFQADWAVTPGDKKSKKQKFKTHQELDEWLLVMRQAHPDLESKHFEDWNYLLLLDRCFWCGVECKDAFESGERDRPRADGCALGPPAFQKVMELELGSGPKKNQVIKKKGSTVDGVKK